MALPKLNDNPKYELIIPSTEQKVRFRPYLVKEEKVLMLAAESGDMKASMTAIIDTLQACIQDEVKFSELTTFDIEYAFIQIRSKAVGENSKINGKCSECGGLTEVSVPLDQIIVEVPETEMKVDLTKNISISLSWPKYLDVVNADITDMNTTEQTFRLLIECIDEVFTEDEVIKFSDETLGDRTAFVESLDSNQFKILRDFVENMPNVAHTLEFDCTHCKHHNVTELKGMHDFL